MLVNRFDNELQLLAAWCFVSHLESYVHSCMAFLFLRRRRRCMAYIKHLSYIYLYVGLCWSWLIDERYLKLIDTLETYEKLARYGVWQQCW